MTFCVGRHHAVSQLVFLLIIYLLGIIRGLYDSGEALAAVNVDCHNADTCGDNCDDYIIVLCSIIICYTLT